jgi:acylphosphatase
VAESGDPEPTTHGLEAVVRGRVQGVGFRWFVQRAAKRLELAGWVANQADGSVRVLAAGPGGDLERLTEALHQGPPGARVAQLAVERVSPPEDLPYPFQIR